MGKDETVMGSGLDSVDGGANVCLDTALELVK
jgi:hypothetical protein